MNLWWLTPHALEFAPQHVTLSKKAVPDQGRWPKGSHPIMWAFINSGCLLYVIQTLLESQWRPYTNFNGIDYGQRRL